MARNNKEAAIAAVVKVTGQTREEVLRANPGLSSDPQPAERPARGAGSTASPTLPVGVTDIWS